MAKPRKNKKPSAWDVVWGDAVYLAPQPPAEALPSLLGMAKLIVGIDWAALFREAWCDDHHAGQVPPVVAAAIDNLRDAIAREEALLLRAKRRKVRRG